MTKEELNRAMAGIMGWTLAEHGRWLDGDTPTIYHAENGVVWNPCGNWEHFGLVLERVYSIWRMMRIELCLDAARVFRMDWSDKGFASDERDMGVLWNACIAILEAWGE